MVYDELFRWFFFNVILSLLPFLCSIFFNLLYSVLNPFYSAVKNGELFIFSAMMSATTIGSNFNKASHNFNVEVSLDVLIFILFISVFSFAVSSLIKLTNSSNINNNFEKNFFYSSIICAIMSISFSSSMFFYR